MTTAVEGFFDAVEIDIFLNLNCMDRLVDRYDRDMMLKTIGVVVEVVRCILKELMVVVVFALLPPPVVVNERISSVIRRWKH